MSYEIVYDRRFIRTPLGITPLILAGSSNCYESLPGGRERRERNWSVLFNLPAATEDELMNAVKDCCGGEFQEHFKWHGKFVNDTGFVTFVRNGIANAVTLEELDEYSHCGSLRCALSIWYRDGMGTSRREMGRSVQTSDELVQWIAEAKDRVANRADREEIYYSMDFLGREPIRIPAKKTMAGPVIAKRGQSYITNCAPGQVETNRDISKALIFANIEEARLRLSPYFVRGTQFIKAENAKVRMEWRFCIRIQGGPRDGLFMERLTRSRFHMTYHHSEARKFPDRKTAERYIEKHLEGRFSVPGFMVYEIQMNGGEARA